MRWIVLTLLLFIASLSLAQTVISGGEVGGTWALAQSPFLVQGDITVPADSVLTIEPGVKIYLDDGCDFIAHGRILALGTAEESILFTASDSTNGWESIRFEDHQWFGTDTSIFSYCEFSYGNAYIAGGAISIIESMNIRFSHCDFNHCEAHNGGSFNAESSALIIEHCRFHDNFALGSGGAISINTCIVDIIDCEISQNRSRYWGGGIDLYYVIDGLLKDLDIHDNHARYGGGISSGYASDAHILDIENCRIYHNSARDYGGGIYFDPGHEQEIVFSEEYRSSIYNNYSCLGSDLASGAGINITIPLDTFTIKSPDTYVKYPTGGFQLSSKVYLLEAPSSHDIYVSPSGCDTNSGDTPTQPLKSINAALRRVNCTPASPGKIHLSIGTYSPETTGDFFPIYMKTNTSLSGVHKDLTILDAQHTGSGMILTETQDAVLEHFTLTGGINSTWEDQPVVYISHCEPLFDHVVFRENDRLEANMVVLIQSKNSDKIYPSFSYCEFRDNPGTGQDICIYDYCSPVIKNTEFLKCDPSENPDEWLTGSGIVCSNNCNPYLTNCRITGYGCGLYYSGDFRVTDCLFLKNDIGLNAWNGYGTTVTNCSFIDNITAIVNSGQLELLNSLVYTVDSLNDQVIRLDKLYGVFSGHIEFDYSDIQGGTDCISLYDSTCTFVWGEGNITEDPLFQDPGSGHYIPGIDSPCLNAGFEDTTGLLLPEFDMALGYRVVYDRIDMGCYEFQWPVSTGELDLPQSNIKIYPNPADNFLVIENPDGAPFSWKMYSTTGELVIQGDDECTNDCRINTRLLSPGTYLVNIRHKDELISKKVIISPAQ